MDQISLFLSFGLSLSVRESDTEEEVFPVPFPFMLAP